MVSILIVTYNNSATIVECLRSLAQETLRDFEVILVDNNSSDNTREIVDALRPDLNYALETHFLTKNTGFPGGNKEALRHASGDYIALLNPDTVPDSAWLEEMVKVLHSKQDVGICASRMVVHGRDILDCAGDGFSSWLKGHKRGEGEPSDSFQEPSYVFGASAGAALYRKTMLEEIGFLDEDFFLMHEDTDLNVRAQLAGWRTYYVPTAVVRHKVRSSIGHMSDTAIFYSLRNVECVRIKNMPAGILIRHSILLMTYMFMEFFYFVFRHGKLLLYFKAKGAALKMAPLMLKKRAFVLALKKTSNEEFHASFTHVLDKRSLITNVRRIIFG